MPLDMKKLVRGTATLLSEGKGDPERTVEARRNAEAAAKEVMADPSRRAGFDLGKLWAEVFGWNEFQACRADQSRSATKVMEAAGGVSSDVFLTITQQFIFSTVIDKYELPEFVFSRRIPTRQSPFRYERVPGVSNIGDEALVVGEGKEFPLASPTEDYRETPDTQKRGMRIPITKEAIFFDRTGLVVQRCSELGEWLGLNKEKRAIDAFIDAGETDTFQYRYRWRGVSTNAQIVAIQTYGDNSGDHNWDNLSASTPLTDYESINTAWKLLLAMVDPYTGEPIGDMLQPKDIVFPPSLVFKQPFSVGGEVKRMNPGYATSGNPNQTALENPVGKIVGNLTPLWSQLLQARMTAASIPADTWWLGSIDKMLEYVENWPIQVLQLGSGSQDEFTHDIVQQFRVSERGTFATKQPRATVKCTA